MKNIVLIGMPGSGKTTISEALSKAIQWPVIDLDDYLVSHFQMSIPEMFAISEDYFRDRETIICHHVKNLENTIIACGGGVVLREQNIAYLKENGVICLLNRDLEKIMKDIDTSTRPLLKEGKKKLELLYKIRKPLYEKSADLMIDNNGRIEDTVANIKESLL